MPNLQPELLEAPHCILLVEDDAVLRGLLADALRDVGMRVVEAANADDARGYLQASGSADLLFTDVEMPGSVDGVALARWVRRNYPEIRIIITSGTMAPATALGVFLPKPYAILNTAEIARNMVKAKQGDGR